MLTCDIVSSCLAPDLSHITTLNAFLSLFLQFKLRKNVRIEICESVIIGFILAVAWDLNLLVLSL